MLYPFSRLCRPARSPASCGAALRRKRGFNLIESAVVLGVVGLVIGGIWVAAAAVNENLKAGRTVSGVLTIAKNTQTVISIADSLVIGTSSITSTLLAADVFPKDWVYGSSVKHPFGGRVSVSNFASPGRFDLYLYGVPKTGCIKLITSVSSMVKESGSASLSYYRGNGLGLIQVYNDSTDVFSLQTTNFPVTPAQAAAACVWDTADQSVALTFGYTRTN